MKITLQPSYATTNTVRFDEVTGEAKTNEATFLVRTSKAQGAMGDPLSQYFNGEQLSALGWEPTSVGDEYVAEGARGKTYVRRDVSGPKIQIDFKVV